MTRDRCGVHVGELRPRRRRLDPGLLGRVHRVVDHPLVVGEPSVHRQGPGDVGGVERVQLDASVEQQQVALADVAVVADPVQRAGVVTGGRDGVVADRVADVPGVQAEDALHPALTPAAADRLGQVGHHGGEGLGGPAAGLPQLLDLERVLGQPELAEGLGQLGVGGELALLARGLGGADLGDHGGHLGLEVDRQHPERGGVGVLAEVVGQVADVGAGDAAERRPSPPATAGRRPRARRSGRRRRTPRSPGARAGGSRWWRRGRCRWAPGPARRPARGRCPDR